MAFCILLSLILFDQTSLVSFVPESCALPVGSEHSLVTTWSSGGAFSCLLHVQRRSALEVRLGADWLAAFREHYILNGEHPPAAGSIVLFPFSGENQAISGFSRSVEAIGHELPQSSTDTSPDLGVVFGTICDTESSRFVMLGRSTQTVHHALSDHGILYDGLSFDLCRQALCHHLVNGLCSSHRSSSSLCSVVAGSCSPDLLVTTISSVLLTLAGDPSFSLILLREICVALGIRASGSSERHHLLTALEARHAALSIRPSHSLHSVLFGVAELFKPQVLACAAAHGLTCAGTVSEIQAVIYEHMFQGECASTGDTYAGCHDVQDTLAVPVGVGVDDFQIRLLSVVIPRASRRFLIRLLDSRGLSYDITMSISHLRRILKHHVRSLVKAKGSENVAFQARDSYDAGLQEVRSKWPSLVSDTMKDDIASLFRSETSSDALREVVCACCAESVLLSLSHVVPSAILDLDILRVPVQDEGSTDGSETDSGDELGDDISDVRDEPYFMQPGLIPPILPEVSGELENHMLHPAGVLDSGDDGELSLQLCGPCSWSLRSN